MDYKEETIRSYDAYADVFDRKFGEHFELRVKQYADQFIGMLSGPRILDLGSGPGNHAVYFRERGLDVLCVDLSREMVERCREKGLHAELGDIESLNFDEESFDGIWAYASLLHVPKEQLPDVVRRLYVMLKPDGILAIAMKEGQGEKFVEKPETYAGTKRWFVYVTEDEIRELFRDGFECIDMDRDRVNDHLVFLHAFFRKV